MPDPITRHDLRSDAYGRTKAVIDYSINHGLFTFDVPQSMWLQFEDGSEVTSSTEITSVDGELTITSAGSGTSRSIESRNHSRYQPNRGLLWSGSIFIDDTDSDGIVEFGSNRMFFRMQSGVLYMVLKTYQTGTGYVEYTEVFPVPDDWDLSKGHLYDIQAQLRMVGSVTFGVGGSNGYVYRTMDLLGTLDRANIDDPALSHHFYVEGASTNPTLRVGCCDITSEGGAIDTEQYQSFTVTRTLTTDGPIAAIRQPATIGGRENTRDIRLARIIVTADKKETISLYQTRDATALTGDSFSAINNGSYVESDSSATALDTGKARLVMSQPVQANIVSRIDNPFAPTIEYKLIHGDYIILYGTASTTAYTVVVEWGERV